jgi:glycosyltransferase involved in cell wall biosynthesis
VNNNPKSGDNSSEVVHVVARYPPALGGTEKVAQGLAEAQHQIGMRVRVLTSDVQFNELEGGEDFTFPILRLKSFDVAHTTIMPSLLSRLMRLDPNSTIHLHIASAYVPEVVWIYARIRGCPYVAHVHLDVLPSGKAGFLLEPYKKVLLRRVLRSASAIVVPTDDYQKLISHKYRIAQERITVLPNGTTHRIAERHKTLWQKDGKAKLLFVGRLSVQKNIPLLLEAIAVYIKKYSNNIELAIVGDGEDRSAVQSQIQRLRLGDVVSLQGPAYGEALESIYESSDLFILTSINESFGLVFIEAMSKGLPIVTVNIPAVRNVVSDGINGLLAESNPERIAEAIHTLLSNEILYSAISRNNLAKSYTHDWKVIAKRLSTIYESANFGR